MGILLRLLAPIAPHITHQLWDELNYEGVILNAPWPKASLTSIKIDFTELVVQINGKLRSRIQIPANADQTAVEAIALSDSKVQTAVAGKEIKKMIFVRGKLLNIVVGEK
jgi:leucyl-tRNA synthetase